ncbi:MAG: Ppx/GppA phosphatase family protein [Bifidobacteriaceae bacterium]|nr:Ppx/GppA phosphatase family protein [Bifidobacteriaceae bacterium]
MNSHDSVIVAGVDCGTNSIRLKIARVTDHGMRDIVPRELRVIRLGQDVDTNHRFAKEALERAYCAANEFAQILSQHEVQAMRFVATSATRDAANRQEFEDTIEQILGVRPEVISGKEEAALSFLGATSVVSRENLEAPYIVVDLGGGSTELVLGGNGVEHSANEVQAAYSMNIGSVRMTERHLHHDPPTQDEIDEAIADIDEHIQHAFEYVPAGNAKTIIGVSGTVTTMTALSMGLTEYNHKIVDGVRTSIADAIEVNNRFLNMTRENRAQYHTIHPGRIDVVGGGALVWSRVLHNISQASNAVYGKPITSYVASEHGLLDGLVLDLGRLLLEEK